MKKWIIVICFASFSSVFLFTDVMQVFFLIRPEKGEAEDEGSVLSLAVAMRLDSTRPPRQLMVLAKVRLDDPPSPTPSPSLYSTFFSLHLSLSSSPFPHLSPHTGGSAHRIVLDCRAYTGKDDPPQQPLSPHGHFLGMEISFTA